MDTDLQSKLLEMVRRDSETREQLVQEKRLYGRYDAIMQKVHIENAHELAQLINRHGWPGISRVGIEGSRAAWLIAQHAICTPKLQKRFFRMLSSAAEKGEASRKQVAMLIDRIRFNEGKPQLYGTVLDWTEDQELGCEVEWCENLDEKRASVGLPPYEQSRLEQQKIIAAEGGQPPEDFHAYKQAARAWSRQVGWIR